MSDRGPWIETFTGKAFHLLDPRPEEVCIEDIAHGLSQACRFNYQTRRFYSVAEHSYHISLLCQPENALWGLLDDAEETYIGDMSRPLKHHTEMGRLFQLIAAPIKAAIRAKFGLVGEPPAEIKKWDEAILWTEKLALMTALSWEECIACGVSVPRADVRIACYRPPVIERIFISRFRELTAS